MDIFDRKILYFNDPRVLYSVNDLKILIEDEVATTPESIVRITEGLTFRAGDILNRATSTIHDLLSLTIDEPINC